MATSSKNSEVNLAQIVEELRAEVAQLKDRQQIHDVYLRYMWGFDRRDMDVASSAFWPDAEINYGVTSYQSGEAFLAAHFAAHDRETTNSRHLITEQSVDIDAYVAHVEAYVTEFSTLRNGRSRIVGARYIDRLDRRDAEWRIAVRETFFQFFTETDNNRDTNQKIQEILEREYSKSPRGNGSLDKRDLAYARPLVARRDATS